MMAYLSKKKWGTVKKETVRLLRRELDETEMWIEDKGESLVMSTERVSFTLDGARMALRLNGRKGGTIGKMCMMEAADLAASAFARLLADIIELAIASVEAGEESHEL